jgi:hypothetical protein
MSKAPGLTGGEMETFAPPKEFVPNPGFTRARAQMTAAVPLDDIDAPLRDIVSAFNALPHCYTLQCCWGHFLHGAERDSHNLLPLPTIGTGPVEYRIAYLALCLEESEAGRRLRSLLEQVPEIDPEYIQFGSPDWFWDRWINSYALQVEPERLKDRDVALIEHDEALRVQEVRGRFFKRLWGITGTEADRRESGAA